MKFAIKVGTSRALKRAVANRLVELGYEDSYNRAETGNLNLFIEISTIDGYPKFGEGLEEKDIYTDYTVFSILEVFDGTLPPASKPKPEPKISQDSADKVTAHVDAIEMHLKSMAKDFADFYRTIGEICEDVKNEVGGGE
jgi:hypothetical protein